MDGTERVERLITPVVMAMGYDIVRVQRSGGRRPVLQVMAERKDGAAMTVDDCAEVSRTISALLDVDDSKIEPYYLEVSSPGIDRPLTRLSDYESYAGFEARIETRELVGGRRRFRGMLKGLVGDAIRLEVEGQLVEIPFAGILRAKLLLTDELIASGPRSC
ncbi:MAG: ribosome maturation factor RimP [Rhodospirillaceae bacterium]